MDGWNKSKVMMALSILSDARDYQYELENCRRGCYTNCKTYQGLAGLLEDLADRLNACARDLKYEEEDEEEDEDS